jgi:hypothetical protein
MSWKLQVAALTAVVGCVGLALAADQSILGKVLSVKDPKPGVDATKRKVIATATEKSSPNTIVGDPTLLSPAGGGVLEVSVAGAVDLSQTFVLPQGTSSAGQPFWAATATGFTYKDPSGDQGAVKSITIKRSGAGTVVLKAKVLGKNGTVDVLPPNAGTAGCVALQLGVDAGFGDRYSVQFGDDSEITNSGAKAFTAKKPTEEGVCAASTTTTIVSPTTTTSLVDPCATGNGGCDPLTSCTNDGGTPMCGPCPGGYTGTGNTACTDINECATNNGGCDNSPPVLCTNLAGAPPSCGPCPAGYTGPGTSCVDVNECATTNGGCFAGVTCTNTAGSSSCGPCPAFYTGNGMTCTDINECATNNGGCDNDPPVVCTNLVGASPSCGPCPTGYTGPGTSCVDVNECATANGGCMVPTPVCVNTPGGWVCS